MKWIYVFLLSLCLVFNAKANNGFDVGISVNEQGENSAQAKQLAMSKAYKEAFLKVSARLIDAQNIKQLEELTDDQVSHFIREVELVAEKSTSTSYMADLNITINEKLLKQYLTENNLLNSNAMPSKVLVIPVFSDTEYKDKVLFEDGNIWRNSWLEKGQIKSGNFDFDIIVDNPENRNAISSEQFDSIDKSLYENLRIINGVENIFIANAIRAGETTLVLNIKSYPKKSQKSFVVNDNHPFEKAIEQTVSYVTDFMQNKVIDQPVLQGNVDIVSKIKLKDWLEIEKQLNTISQIKKVELKTFGIEYVVFSIDFSGSFDSVITLLAQKGLYLQLIDGYYVLTK